MDQPLFGANITSWTHKELQWSRNFCRPNLILLFLLPFGAPKIAQHLQLFKSPSPRNSHHRIIDTFNKTISIKKDQTTISRWIPTVFPTNIKKKTSFSEEKITTSISWHLKAAQQKSAQVGTVNPILPVVAELVLRGCEVRYYLSKAIDRDRPVADPGVFEAPETMGQCDNGYNGYKWSNRNGGFSLGFLFLHWLDAFLKFWKKQMPSKDEVLIIKFPHVLLWMVVWPMFGHTQRSKSRFLLPGPKIYIYIPTRVANHGSEILELNDF